LGVGREANNLSPEKTALFRNLTEAKTGLILWSDRGEGKDCGPEEDGCQTGGYVHTGGWVSNWRIRAHRRDEWKMVVKRPRSYKDCRAME